ncbi:hypothetical protein DV736_g154, partial [Chaetothyriales sp. CBS 134916]
MKIGPSSTSFARLPTLPAETIEGIICFLDQLQDLAQRQRSLWACCLLSRAWYSGTVKKLYRWPLLTGRNFDLFTRTICPAVHSDARAIGLERLVVDLDMGTLAYESPRHMTARLLRRTKHSLETFVAPAITFSLAGLIPISKSVKLRRLDLSRDGYNIDLRVLLLWLHNLEQLQFLSIPQSALAFMSVSPGCLALQWPPRLTHLQINGDLIINISDWDGLIASFPPSLAALDFVHMNVLYLGWPLRHSTVKARQIKRIVIGEPAIVSELELRGLFEVFPSLVRLSMPMSVWQPAEFDQGLMASKIERLQLMRGISKRTVAPRAMLNFAKSLPALRRIDLEGESFQAIRQTDWNDLEELQSLLAGRDGAGSTFEAAMEIHSVLPEERARDPKGEPLPWAYRYAETSRGVRQVDDSGSFGQHRSLRATGSRTPRSRAGTTPVRQKENPAVAEFGRLAAEAAAQPTPTECLLYGYAGRASEWKVISRFERIVTPGIICEDYPREDANLFLASNSPHGFSKRSIVVHRQMTAEALRKSRVYKGGEHWIKVTFDSYAAAERACFYSPVEIDGYLVHCELWTGRAKMQSYSQPQQARTLPSRESAIAGFERAMQTLPRSHAIPHGQFAHPEWPNEDDSTTASSATAIDHSQLAPAPAPATGLRSRPAAPFTPSTPIPDSEYMTHIPSVKKVVLRPISEALPKQPSLLEQVMKLPILRWFGSDTGGPGDFISAGPRLKDDGTWDTAANSWYWSFWHAVDQWCGTDFCGLKED